MCVMSSVSDCFRLSVWQKSHLYAWTLEVVSRSGCSCGDGCCCGGSPECVFGGGQCCRSCRRCAKCDDFDGVRPKSDTNEEMFTKNLVLKLLLVKFEPDKSLRLGSEAFGKQKCC